MNLLPIRSTALHSDGAHIADARAGNERFARSVALIEIGRAQLEGRPIASLGDDVLARALRPADASLAAMRANSIAFRSMQITVPEAAAPFLEAALASSALATGGERTKLASRRSSLAAGRAAMRRPSRSGASGSVRRR